MRFVQLYFGVGLLVVALGCGSGAANGDKAAGEGDRRSSHAADWLPEIEFAAQSPAFHRRVTGAPRPKRTDRLERSSQPGRSFLKLLNVGAVDVGHAGETPPVFAQAAGVHSSMWLAEDATPESEAIVVLKDSPDSGP